MCVAIGFAHNPSFGTAAFECQVCSLKVGNCAVVLARKDAGAPTGKPLCGLQYVPCSIDFGLLCLLKGSWDLVTRVITRVTTLINPSKVLITLLTKSHDPPSGVLQALGIAAGHGAVI